MGEFSDKVAVVTGGASGIGRVSAQHYAAKGAKVVVSDLSEEGGAETADLIEADGGEAIFVRTDVSKPEDCRELIRRTMDEFGRLDYACNNAGIGGESNLTGEYSPEGWNQVISVNLSGVFYCMRFEIPAMLESGGGSIVNMASILGQVGFATASAYVAAKHGVVGLTKATALEYAQQDIRVNAIGPAFIRTPLIAQLEQEEQTRDMLISRHPMGRLGESAEVAELVTWLSSEKASFVTGSYYPVDGGYLAW